jgi:hypothetical protein
MEPFPKLGPERLVLVRAWMGFVAVQPGHIPITQG